MNYDNTCTRGVKFAYMCADDSRDQQTVVLMVIRMSFRLYLETLYGFNYVGYIERWETKRSGLYKLLIFIYRWSLGHVSLKFLHLELQIYWDIRMGTYSSCL